MKRKNSASRQRRSRYRFDEVPSVPFSDFQTNDIPARQRVSSNDLDFRSRSFETNPIDEGYAVLHEDSSLPYGFTVQPEDDCPLSSTDRNLAQGMATNNEIELAGYQCAHPEFQNCRMESARIDESTPDLSEEFDNIAACSSSFAELTPPNPGESSESTLKLSHWPVIWGLVMTNGTQELTKVQYQAVRYITDSFLRIQKSPNILKHDNSMRITGITDKANTNKVTCLPHYSTLHKRYKPILVNELAPRALLSLENVDLSKAGARSTSHSSSGQPQIAVRTIMPSDYARADVETPEVWDQMCSTSMFDSDDRLGELDKVPFIGNLNCVDVWPVVAARRWFYGPPTAISVNSNLSSVTSSFFAEAGDTVLIDLIDAHSPVEEIFRAFGADNDGSVYSRVRARLVSIWTVHSSAREMDSNFAAPQNPTLRARDVSIMNTFNFVEYRSPVDCVSVSIPDVPPTDEENADEEENCNAPYSIEDPRRKRNRISPEISEAINLRREAIAERKRKLADAWSDWVKPVVKPGDLVALIEPVTSPEEHRISCSALLTSTDCAGRLCLVSRFWAENEERATHLFWIPGGREISECTSPRMDASLRRLCSPMMSDNPSLTVDVKSVHLSSVHSGRRGVEKFCPVSSKGNLEDEEPYFVYRFILFWDGFEVQTGKPASGDGFYMMCINLPPSARSSPSAVRVISVTPPGVKSEVILQRIKSDIITGMTEGFVDIDATGTKRRIFLDLVGCIGDTPAINCALDVLGHTANSFCHLCRNVRRSNTLVGSIYATVASHGFSSAVARTYFQHRAVRDCHPQKETCQLLGIKHLPSSANLILHDLKEEMMSVRTSVRTTSYGLPVVPCDIDPYRASFVAPDHLLTGHLRDCISLAFKLLPSKEHRTASEGFMKKLLSDASLPVQSRLFDHVKKSLLSMSMTELYGLSVVAETGFFLGCHAVERDLSCLPLPEKTQEAIALVGSCSRLIAELWFLPEESKDGSLLSSAFNVSNGIPFLSRLQNMVAFHIQKVISICTMPDEDVLTLEDSRCCSARRSSLNGVYRACLTAIKVVDKPNVHRLYELVYVTLPMVGHVSRLGELVLENTHQALKRAIKLSNNKDAHLQAMKSAAIIDWQGRLSMSISSALDGEKDHVRLCFRLLAGSEAVMSQTFVSTHVQGQAQQALGPNYCLRLELSVQGKSVISTRMKSSPITAWSLLSPCSSSTTTILEDHTVLCSSLSETFAEISTGTTLTISDAVTSSAQYGRAKVTIVAVLTCYPNNPERNFPFVVQSPSAEDMSPDTRLTSPSLWMFAGFISLKRPNTSALIYAILRPCLRLPSQGLCNMRTRYQVQIRERVSLASLGADVREVPTLHDCSTTNCVVTSQTSSNDIDKCQSPMEGSSFFALNSWNGYPPRCG